MERRCGFVAILGAPNAGKSTLLNRLVGTKVSIVTHKVQTTRSRVRGIFQRGESQIILVDLPGIMEPRRRLERAMVTAAWDAAEDADVLLLLFDASRKEIDADTRLILDKLDLRPGQKLVLALNKIDRIKREKLLALADDFTTRRAFDEIFMVSALNGDGIEDLADFLAGALPPSEWLYPEDQVSDLPLRLLAAEITREKLFLSLHQELPYGLTVESEGWEEFKNGDVKIQQVIYLARPQHKGMVLGKGGAKIKAIRSEAQKELEKILERRVHLFLFVKVRENWSEDPERYRDWGLDFNA
jgi:GTP-binding protein Era